MTETELSRLLHELPLTEPSPDLLPRVHRRLARRRGLRFAAAGTAVLLGAGAATGLVLARPRDVARLSQLGSAGPGSTVVAWVDQPATPPAPPPLQGAPAPPPPAYPACTASQLQGSSAPGGAATGNLLSVVVLTNVGPSPCSLSGYPASLVGVHADGTRQVFSPLHGTAFDASFAWPANLRPGDSGRLGIVTWDGCSAAQAPGAFSDPATSYTAELVGVPGGGSVHATAPFNAVCGVGVTTFGVPQPQPESTGSYPGLGAKANVAATVVAGTTLSYTVTLTNSSAKTVSLNPCPVYTEGIYGRSAHLHSYRLNCSTVHSIAAGDSVTYAMRIPVPAGYQGVAKFGWSIPGSAAAFAGTEITIAASPSADGLCRAALDGRALNSFPTTLGAARAVNVGGAYPGLRPARNAFPGLPPQTQAAWCWTAATSASPGPAGAAWRLYLAVPGGRAQQVFSMGGGSKPPPPGPPAIP